MLADIKYDNAIILISAYLYYYYIDYLFSAIEQIMLFVWDFNFIVPIFPNCNTIANHPSL